MHKEGFQRSEEVVPKGIVRATPQHGELDQRRVGTESPFCRALLQ
jgi:hypothetical protein